MPRQPAKPEERIACCRCGKNKKETEFYKVPSSPLWTATKNRAPFCKDCIEQIYRDYSVQYGGRAAIIAVAALLDYPFAPDVYETLCEKYGACSLGNYIRSMNAIQYKSKALVIELLDRTNVDYDCVNPRGYTVDLLMAHPENIHADTNEYGVQNYNTSDLVSELTTRPGVTIAHALTPDSDMSLSANGPAEILFVLD